MKLLKKYIILCGLLFNIVLFGIIIVETTASRPMAMRGLDLFLEHVTKDHPFLARIIMRGNNGQDEAVVPNSYFNVPEELPFKLVDVVYDVQSPRPEGRILSVGPGRELSTPSAAAKVAEDGDTVLIDPGDYPGDVAIWRTDNITLKGNGGIVRLDASGTKLPQKKAIWLIQGNNTRVENVEFTGARSADRNGAGIRSEGAGLHIINCYFHNNEEGILSGRNMESEIIIEHSEFARNGHSGGQAHNLYIGEIAKLIFRFNYVHHGIIGSNLKSRAHENYILYNRIMDYADGRVNYGIDISNGGLAYIIGNIIQQGALTENYHLLTFAPEGAKHKRQELYVVHNTFVNDRSSGQFIRNNTSTSSIYNNLFVGPGGIVTGTAVLVGNVVAREKSTMEKMSSLLTDDDTLNGEMGSGKNKNVSDASLLSRKNYNYNILSDSAAVDNGAQLGSVDGMDLIPRYQYHHPRQGKIRELVNTPDAGAYEAQESRL